MWVGSPRVRNPDLVIFIYIYGIPRAEPFRVVRRLYSKRIETPTPSGHDPPCFPT
jgi:hypothetical protein